MILIKMEREKWESMRITSRLETVCINICGGTKKFLNICKRYIYTFLFIFDTKGGENYVHYTPAIVPDLIIYTCGGREAREGGRVMGE